MSVPSQRNLGTVKSSPPTERRVLDSVAHEAPYDAILVHGAGGNNLLWKRTLQYLGGPSTATAVNLPGHPSGEITCRTVEDYSEALHDFIVESRILRPVVCGHSMGSAVTLKLAIGHPEDVGGLVLVSAGAKMGVDPNIVEGLRGRPMEAIEQIITPRSFYSIDFGLGREARAALSVSNLPVFLNDYLACNGFDVRDRLKEITARTLIICGEDDRLTPPKWADYLKANIASSEAVIIGESGHRVPLERPETCAKAIQAFLSVSR